MFNLKENNSWTYIKLGDIVTVKHGYAFKGSNFTSENTHKVVLTPGNFKIGGGFKSEKFKFTTEECPSEYVLQGGDIVVSMTDLSKYGDTLGYSALIPKDSRYKYLHNQRIGLIKFKKEDVSRDFIYWVLRTRDFNRFLVGSATGSTVKHTSPSIIGEYHFMIPNSRSEQDSISKILSDLDAKIELNQKMNKTLESIAEAIFKHWFIDFEFPNEDRKPYKSSGGEMVDSELGEIPKGWVIKKFWDLGKIVCGKTPSTKDITNFGQDIPFITIPDMSGNVFTFKTERSLSTKGANSQKTKFLPPLSVCVSCIATPGIVTLTSTVSQTNQQINSIVCKENISPFFVYFMAKEKSSEIINKGSGGTTTLNLNTSEFSNLRIIFPDAITLGKFNNFATHFFNKILDNSKEILALTDIRDSLLPKLISGKIRVPLEG